MRLEVYGASHMGRVRVRQEDSFGCWQPETPRLAVRRGSLFIVADGMGGHPGGDVASTIATWTVETRYRAVGILTDAVLEANRRVRERQQRDTHLQEMGSTCTALVILDTTAEWAHVGDSRLYHLRHGVLRQLTHDHTLAEECIRIGTYTGLMTPEEIREEFGHILVNRLGVPRIQVETNTFAVLPGDKLLLCTDGLTRHVDDEMIQIIVGSNPPRQAVEYLIRLANANGGTDNITAIVVKVHDS